MIITKAWIHAHRTPAGAWNRKQMGALGLDWPAKKGWIKRLEGTEISHYKSRLFESHAASTEKRMSKRQIIHPSSSGVCKLGIYINGASGNLFYAECGRDTAKNRIRPKSVWLDDDGLINVTI